MMNKKLIKSQESHVRCAKKSMSKIDYHAEVHRQQAKAGRILSRSEREKIFSEFVPRKQKK